MKTILMLTGCLILTGCYTQFNAGSSSSGTRTPNFSKVETQVDENTRVTDYYDNNTYSWYLRNFNYGFGYRYYDMYGYDPVADYYSTYNTWGWGNRGYFDMGYDYIDYRMDQWYWRNFGYYPNWGFYNQPVVYYYPYDGGGTPNQNPVDHRRRSSRQNTLVDANSSRTYMPVSNTELANSSVYRGSSSATERPSGRNSRSQVTETPAVSRSGAASSPAAVSTGSATQTGTVAPPSNVRRSRDQVQETPSKSPEPTAQPTPQRESQPASQPEVRQAAPAPAPQQAPAPRRNSRGRGN